MYMYMYMYMMRATLGKITRVTPQNNFSELFWGASVHNPLQNIFSKTL